MAKLYFRYGAMNSGKSTLMLQAAYNYEERGHNVVLCKPEIDIKGDKGILSRLGINRKTDFVIGTDSTVLDVIASEVSMDTHADKALELLRNS